MDGSRRSVARQRAYFTGIGRNKRIVFFDTLLERLQAQEIEAVLAHELGHFRLHHIRSRLILSVRDGRLLGFALLDALAAWPDVLLGARRERARARTRRCCSSCSCCPPFTFFLTPLERLVVAQARVRGG